MVYHETIQDAEDVFGILQLCCWDSGKNVCLQTLYLKENLKVTYKST